jgi:hypothetical protein
VILFFPAAGIFPTIGLLVDFVFELMAAIGVFFTR